MKTILNFEIERGKLIDQYRFAVNLKLTDSSKDLLRQELVNFSNLDGSFTLNHNNFYIYHNKSEYVDRNELYVKDNNGKYLKSNFPLDNC